jgi:hypothetical protein
MCVGSLAGEAAPHLNTISNTVGFFKYRMLPEDGLWKTDTCWGLKYIYLIFKSKVKWRFHPITGREDLFGRVEV